MTVKTTPNVTSAAAPAIQIRRHHVPSRSIVQPARNTAAKTMTHSDGTSR